MAATSTHKGSAGEREALAILRNLGFTVTRRPRYTQGHDLTLAGGLHVVEVKRHATVTPGKVNKWWAQACRQAEVADALPLLLYRGDRQPWTAVVEVDGERITLDVDGLRQFLDSVVPCF